MFFDSSKIRKIYIIAQIRNDIQNMQEFTNRYLLAFIARRAAKITKCDRILNARFLLIDSLSRDESIIP